MMENIKTNKNKILVIAVAIILALSVMFISLQALDGNSADAATYPEGDLDELNFTIDTGDYINGICATSGNLPVIELTLVGENIKAGQTTFWYCEQDAIGIPDAQATWKKIEDFVTTDNVAVLTADYLVMDNEFYSKYIYFKTVIAKQDSENPAQTNYFEYVNPRFVDLVVDRSIDVQGYEISNIVTTYKTSDNIDETYDTNNPVWVSTSITFNIYGYNLITDNTIFEYSFQKDTEGNNIWLPASIIEASDGTYYASATIAETYKGPVRFRSSDRSSSISYSYDGHRYIMLDTKVPAYTVKAEMDIPNASEEERYYSSNIYSSVDVIYTVTPVIEDEDLDESKSGSGAKYYYSLGEQGENGRIWYEMPVVNGVYTHIVTQTTTQLYFKAVSNAGKDSSNQGTVEVNYRTYIDKEKPQLSLTATDGSQSIVKSLGSPEGAGYKVGYASNLIKFNVLNTNLNNSSKITFEYMIDDGGPENYIRIEANEVIFNEPFVNRKFKIRARSEAGLADTVEFTVSILKSDFSFEWAEDIQIETNINGWARYEIPVYFILPTVLNTVDEYAFYSQITGNSTSAKKMDVTRISVTTGAGGKLYSTYKLFIDRSLNNQTMDFYAFNKAGDRSVTLTTPEPIKLDLVDPDSTVTKQIYNSNVILSEDDWANGRVVIIITPVSENKSGLKCYPLVGGQRAKEIVISNGVFSYQATVTGTYNFVLVSGADRTQNISVVVKIDTSDILFDGLSATVEEIVFDDDGEHVTDKPLALTQNGDYYTVDKIVSSDVTVLFDSNHAGHFTYYYQRYTGATPVSGGYTHITDIEEFVIPISEFESIENGTVKYAFYLESKAVDSNGDKKITRVKYLTVNYNIKDFSITVEYYQGSDDWTGNDIEFTINVDSEDVQISQYQLQLITHDGVRLGWKDITPYITIKNILEPNKATYIFEGIEQIDPATGTVFQYAFNGKLLFRAVNTAGRISTVIGDEINVKIDKTTPDPVHSIKQSAGGEIVARPNGTFVVYSNTTIVLQNTNNNPSKPVFTNLAPITYYYCPDSGTAPSDYSDPNFRELTADTPVTGSYYLYARNSLNAASQIKKYQFSVETVSPTATLSAVNAAIGISGIYEFNWSDVAIVSITAVSQTNVYYWYKIGANGQWTKYNTQAEQAGGLKDIIFVGEYDPRYPNAIVGNMDATVEFRVTNLAGSSCYFAADALVRVRLDVREPEFDMTTTCMGEEIDRNQWQSSEIFIRLFPAEKGRDEEGNEILVPIDPVTANPGGVTYTYRLDASDTFEPLPGDGTFFSTDDLATAVSGGAGFDGNGMVTIYIRATAKESKKYVDKVLTLYVDKVVPDFSLKGEITIPGTANTANIDSGTWTQADEVRISKIVNAVSKSPVTYLYYINNDIHNQSPWNNNNPLVRTEICDLYVTATNGAGVSVTKVFEVKIDNQPPLINSGIIRNAVIINPDNTESIDRLHPNTYYIDQVITYIEPNLKYAWYNNFPLSNGQIIATNTVDNSNTGGLPEGKGGYVHIVVEDMAGNKSELIFYMTIFELTINTITLSQEHRDLLEKYEEQFEEGKSGLTESRRAYFESQITRLQDRLATLQKQVNDYQAYLTEINNKSLFTLVDDYDKMFTYLNYFKTNDETILYPEWQQNMIKKDEYALYYNKLETEFAKLDALMSTVKNIQKDVSALSAINVVKREDYTSVLRVYNAYQSMLGTQKEVFDTGLYTKLIELKRRCEVLLLQDPATGIKIEGDDLAPGAAIQVINFDKTSEYVNNAQRTLLETIPENMARAIIYVKKLALTDFGSQYNTGTITITLPILDDFQNYKNFGVYRYTSDGTVIPIEDFIINGDGKSIYFSDTSLDTYILAADAIPTVRPPSEKIYGVINDIEIDATLLSYITYAACGMFGILLVVIIIIAIRHGTFVRRYNKSYKRSLVERGIHKIPKGNPPPRTNPADIGERLDYNQKVYDNRN